MRKFTAKLRWYLIGRSVVRLWRIKLGWTIVCLAGFLVAYFFTQRVEFFPSRWVPATPIDQWVAFDPRWTLVYQSLWLFLPIGPWLARHVWQIRCYVVGFALTCAVAFPIFIVWPVDAPRPDVIPNHAPYRLLVSVDALRNNIPSMHAALGIYSLLVAHHLFKPLISPRNLKTVTLLAALWLTAILYATLATAQHWFIDLPPGLLLGAAAYFYAWRRSKQNQTGELPCVPSPLSS